MLFERLFHPVEHNLHGADQAFGRVINVLMKVDDAVFPSPTVGGPPHGGNIVRRV
jgi:hypothetical protein